MGSSPGNGKSSRGVMTPARIAEEKRRSRNAIQKRAIAVPTGAKAPVRMHRVVITTVTEERRSQTGEERDLSLSVNAHLMPIKQGRDVPMTPAINRRDAPMIQVADRSDAPVTLTEGRSDAPMIPAAGLIDALPALTTDRNDVHSIQAAGRNDAPITPTAGLIGALPALTTDRSDVHSIPTNRAIIKRETTVKGGMHLTTVRKKVTVQLES